MNSQDGNINNLVVVIIAHFARQERANTLRDTLAAEGVTSVILTDDVGRGALWGHKNALRFAVKYPTARFVFMEDDAQPVTGFKDKALAWINRYPKDLISFYLGTSRPPIFQPHIGKAITDGDEMIRFGTLIHGVCYTMPNHTLAHIAYKLKPNLPADFAIGEAYRGNVIYPIKSLVDHADDTPVEFNRRDNDPRTEQRKAWLLDK